VVDIPVVVVLGSVVVDELEGSSVVVLGSVGSVSELELPLSVPPAPPSSPHDEHSTAATAAIVQSNRIIMPTS
jgi:hypothetical protein